MKVEWHNEEKSTDAIPSVVCCAADVRPCDRTRRQTRRRELLCCPPADRPEHRSTSGRFSSCHSPAPVTARAVSSACSLCPAVTQCIHQRFQLQSGLLEYPVHEAFSCRKACLSSRGRNLKNRDLDCRSAVGSHCPDSLPPGSTRKSFADSILAPYPYPASKLLSRLPVRRSESGSCTV